MGVTSPHSLVVEQLITICWEITKYISKFMNYLCICLISFQALNLIICKWTSCFLNHHPYLFLEMLRFELNVFLKHCPHFLFRYCKLFLKFSCNFFLNYTILAIAFVFFETLHILIIFMSLLFFLSPCHFLQKFFAPILSMPSLFAEIARFMLQMGELLPASLA